MSQPHGLTPNVKGSHVQGQKSERERVFAPSPRTELSLSPEGSSVSLLEGMFSLLEGTLSPEVGLGRLVLGKRTYLWQRALHQLGLSATF